MEETLLAALFTVIAEKGIEGLGKGLKQSTIKLWKRLKKHCGDIPDFEKCTVKDARRIAQAIESASSTDGEFAEVVAKWSKAVASQISPANSPATVQQNTAKGIFAGCSISQSNKIA